MDTISKEKKNEVMSHIRSKETKLEMVVRWNLHVLGFRHSLHPSKLPDCPDIVSHKWYMVIFVGGCFWYRHEWGKTATMLKSKVEFWQAKLDRNVVKNRKKHAVLKQVEWRVIVIWECELDNLFGDLASLITIP